MDADEPKFVRMLLEILGRTAETRSAPGPAGAPGRGTVDAYCTVKPLKITVASTRASARFRTEATANTMTGRRPASRSDVTAQLQPDAHEGEGEEPDPDVVARNLRRCPWQPSESAAVLMYQVAMADAATNPRMNLGKRVQRVRIEIGDAG